MDNATNEVDFDVIVIGGGVAGTVCAYQLAQAGKEVILLERGEQPGSKNLSGGVFYCQVMEQVFPDFVKDAPVERRITRNVLSFLNPSSHFNIDYWDKRLKEPANAVSVLRAKLDEWLSAKCEEAGVMVMPNIRVDGLLFEGDLVVGVKADEDELRAHIVVVADGVNSFIAQEAGIRVKEKPGNLAVGVKSVIGLPRKVIEDRFRVKGNDGVAYSIVGDCTQTVAGGGFLYTNRDSVSIGVVLRLDDLEARGLCSSDVHDYFLEHPAIAPLISEGELLEYGCHLTIENGPAMVTHDLTRPGLLIIGDAAGFTLNTGLTIRGMDLAAGSAIAAAKAIVTTFDKGTYDPRVIDAYQEQLKNTFVGADMQTYINAPHFLEIPRLYKDYGELLVNILYDTYHHDTTPKTPVRKTIIEAFKQSQLRLFTVVADGWKAMKSI